MLLRKLFFLTLVNCLWLASQSQTFASDELSLSGFTRWVVGRDSATQQLIPATGLNPLTAGGVNPLTIKDRIIVAHARFKVAKYGEMSFPINPAIITNEAASVDLSKSRYIKIQYKANHEVILQLRQTGVHGGTHNHIILPASDRFITTKIHFSSFKGGLKPLDLKDVAKFNFAFVGNNPGDGFADVIVRSFKIHRYDPSK